VTAGGPITSRHNPRVRALARLRDRRERDATGLVLVDGARETARALAAGVPIREAVVASALVRAGEAEATVAALEAAGVPILPVGPDAFERLAFGDRRDGVVAVAEPARSALSDLELPREPLIAVLDGLEKPGNLGAIARTADAAGVDAILVVDGVTDVYHPNAIRGSLGAIFALPVVTASSEDAAVWLAERAVRVVAAIVDAEQAPWEVDLTVATALAVGSEANGLGPAWRGSRVVPVALPMLGVGDSLNVSAAAAVLFYEARRQRAGQSGRSGTAGGLG
jgi:TrmH family RNA methyltransferase